MKQLRKLWEEQKELYENKFSIFFSYAYISIVIQF